MVEDRRSGPRPVGDSGGRRRSDPPHRPALRGTWDEETAAEVDRRLREHDDRVERLESITESLAGDVHGIRESLEIALARWQAHLDGAATTRVRTNIMWAGYVALLTAVAIGALTWTVRDQLQRFAGAQLAERLHRIELAVEKVPAGAAYRLGNGHPRVAVVQGMIPTVPAVTRDEITAICVRRPTLCEP